MTQKNIEIFIYEIFSKGPKRNYATNKTDVYHIDDTWSLVILDLKDYGPENNRGYIEICSCLHRQFFKIWLDSSSQK